MVSSCWGSLVCTEGPIGPSSLLASHLHLKGGLYLLIFSGLPQCCSPGQMPLDSLGWEVLHHICLQP